MSNIYRVRAVSQGWNGGPGLNTFYFRAADGVAAPDLPTAQLCADRVRAAFQEGNLMYPVIWTMSVEPNVDVLDDITGALVGSFGVVPPAPVIGGGTAGFGPTPSMLLMRLTTSTIVDNHRLRGRAFIGPITSNVDANGSPDAGNLGEVVAMGNVLLAAGAGGPAVVVWHRPRAARPLAVPPVPSRPGTSGVVTSVSAPDKYSVLRSRRD